MTAQNSGARGTFPAGAGETDDFVEFGLRVALAAEGEGAGEVAPIGGIQPVEFTGDEDLQRGALR